MRKTRRKGRCLTGEGGGAMTQREEVLLPGPCLDGKLEEERDMGFLWRKNLLLGGGRVGKRAKRGSWGEKTTKSRSRRKAWTAEAGSLTEARKEICLAVQCWSRDAFRPP